MDGGGEEKTKEKGGGDAAFSDDPVRLDGDASSPAVSLDSSDIRGTGGTGGTGETDFVGPATFQPSFTIPLVPIGGGG